MKTKLIILFFTTFPILMKGQLTVSNTNTAIQLVQNFLIGSGITTSNITSSAPAGCLGSFIHGQSTNLGISSGVIFSTGGIATVPNAASYFLSNNMGGAGDALLTQLSGGYTSYDAVILEFDFIPSGDSIKLRYIFGSEEYPEYVCSQFNDAFGIFISGPNPQGGSYSNQNMALIPNTTTPVSINSVNSGQVGSYGSSSNCVSLNYSNYYVNNTDSTICFDGFTTPLTARLQVVPNQTYHIKIAVSDIGDGIYDSGLFLEANSFISEFEESTLCSTATSACFDVADTYTLNINTLAETGPNYGCLYTQPNPAWFYMKIAQSGDLLLNINSSTGNDLDFACWGPFSDPNNPCNSLLTANCSSCLNNTSDPNFYPSGNLVDCSYDPSHSENCHIANAIVGQYYILMVTNYSNQTGTCTLTQTNYGMPGAASVACNNYLSCSIDSSIVNVGNCDSLNRYQISGTVWVTNPPSSGVFKIKDLASGIELNIPTPFNNTISYSMYVPFAPGNPVLNYKFSNDTCSENKIYIRPKKPTLTVNTINSSCGQSNGYIIVGVTANGIPNYSYTWSTGQTTHNTPATTTYLQNIPAGNYSVSVYNANHCYTSQDFSFSDNGAPTLNLNLIQPNICSSNCNAIMHASVNGTNYPYTYSWSNGNIQTDSTGNGSQANSLCNGICYVTVQDVNHCSNVGSYQINSSDSLTVSLASLQYPSCYGNSDACAGIIARNGTLPYSYEWSSGCNSSYCCNLSAGNYTVTVHDFTGCMATLQISIPDGVVPHNAFSYNDQQNTVSFTNQSTPGTYLWQFGDGNTSTEINPVHTYPTDGLYNACLTLYSCDILTTCQQINITTINYISSENSGYEISPNPSNGYVFISSKHPFRLNQYFILSDILGKIVLKVKLPENINFYTVNFSLPDGLYIGQIYKDNIPILTKKVINQK
jgi:hypothetical protein